MKKYKIELRKSAIKFIDKLDYKEKERILKAISKLPYIGDIKVLKGYSNFKRLRVGIYRIIYQQNDLELIVCVVNIGNRGDIYNNL